MQQDGGFSGVYLTRGGFLAVVVEPDGDNWIGSIDGEAMIWDRDGNSPSHPELDLMTRISGNVKLEREYLTAAR